MFGIGRFSKRMVRAARAGCADAILAATDREALDYFRALEASVYAPDYFINVLPNCGAIYIDVPKAASTRIKTTLARLENGREIDSRRAHHRKDTGLLSPRSAGLSRFHAMATAPDTLIFTVVRNPFARLVSCYRDKFQGLGVSTRSPFLARAERYFGAQRVAIDRAAGLSFAQFVDFACATCADRVDGHWNLQSDIVPATTLRIDVIAKVETLRDDLPRILGRIGGDDVLGDQRRPLNTTPKADPRDWFTDDLAERVREAYAADFARFHYPLDL